MILKSKGKVELVGSVVVLFKIDKRSSISGSQAKRLLVEESTRNVEWLECVRIVFK